MKQAKQLLMITLILPTLASAKTLTVDSAHSSIMFEATHLKVTKIPGRFLEFSGTIDLDEKDFTKSKVTFDVNIASITTGVSKRDDHLKTADFFDAEKFATATFNNALIKKSGKKHIITGDLTIRGTSKKISFQVQQLGVVKDPMLQTSKHVFRASGKINRKDFGVSYGPDTIIGDEVTLWINLEAMPTSEPKKQ
ncbi:MAG: YceI family protein [Bdellovibrionota bacterium]